MSIGVAFLNSNWVAVAGFFLCGSFVADAASVVAYAAPVVADAACVVVVVEFLL